MKPTTKNKREGGGERERGREGTKVARERKEKGIDIKVIGKEVKNRGRK